MRTARTNDWKVRSELTFWAGFAVVLALLCQALFPPQVMAETVNGRTQFVLCSDAPGIGPVVDKASEKLFQAHKSTAYQGLKCANCVIASVTALPVPAGMTVPVSYAVTPIELRADPARAPVQPRAPPRPFSCGPPAQA